MGKITEMPGCHFGRLTVVSISEAREDRKTKHTFWRCLCSCGKTVDVDGTKLRNGHTKSCGCYKLDAISTAQTVHGESHQTPEYQTWCSIRQRCFNKNSADYPDYGGRGITVCLRWSNYENFLEDMGRRPQGCSINRIDNDGDYTPQNCEWSDKYQQARNRRSNKYIVYLGMRMTATEAAKRAGIKKGTLLRRIRVGALDLFAVVKPWGRKERERERLKRRKFPFRLQPPTTDPR